MCLSLHPTSNRKEWTYSTATHVRSCTASCLSQSECSQSGVHNEAINYLNALGRIFSSPGYPQTTISQQRCDRLLIVQTQHQGQSASRNSETFILNQIPVIYKVDNLLSLELFEAQDNSGLLQSGY